MPCETVPRIEFLHRLSSRIYGTHARGVIISSNTWDTRRSQLLDEEQFDQDSWVTNASAVLRAVKRLTKSPIVLLSAQLERKLPVPCAEVNAAMKWLAADSNTPIVDAENCTKSIPQMERLVDDTHPSASSSEYLAGCILGALEMLGTT